MNYQQKFLKDFVERVKRSQTCAGAVSTAYPINFWNGPYAVRERITRTTKDDL